MENISNLIAEYPFSPLSLFLLTLIRKSVRGALGSIFKKVFKNVPLAKILNIRVEYPAARFGIVLDVDTVMHYTTKTAKKYIRNIYLALSRAQYVDVSNIYFMFSFKYNTGMNVIAAEMWYTIARQHYQKDEVIRYYVIPANIPYLAKFRARCKAIEAADTSDSFFVVDKKTDISSR